MRYRGERALKSRRRSPKWKGLLLAQCITDPAASEGLNLGQTAVQQVI